MFDAQIARQLWESLPEECRRDHFDSKTMPDSYRGAIVAQKWGGGTDWASVALSMRGLPETITWELAWLLYREVELGHRIGSLTFNRTTRCIRFATSEGGAPARNARSLLDLTADEWLQQVRGARFRGASLGESNDDAALHRIRRLQDILVYAYHRGEWWRLDVWNPVLDRRIPQRDHEPMARHVANFSRLTSDWLRDAAKWWLASGLEEGRYSWSTIKSRLDALKWLQRYLDEIGDAGPTLIEPQGNLRQFVKGFLTKLRSHTIAVGPRAGEQLKGNPHRQILGAIEQFYQWMFDNRDEAEAVLNDERWRSLTSEYSVLFRPSDKPRLTNKRRDDLVLEDSVVSQIAAGAELLARPQGEGGFEDLSAFNALMLLIRTGRRINEVLMMDFDPLQPLVGKVEADESGLVARLRYQQTKIESEQPSSIPVDAEVVAIVRAQQEVARQHMVRCGQPGRTPKYLFLAQRNNRNGDRHYPAATMHSTLGRLGTMLGLTDSQGKSVSVSKTHSFRHTLATNLLNAGVPLHVVMRYFGHVSPEMTLHYAMTLAQTAEREFLRFKKITNDGQELAMNPSDLYDVLQLDQRADRILPNGWCLLPPKQVCDRGNACLSCNKFVTDASHAPVLSRQLGETERLLAERKAAFLDRYGMPMSDDNVWVEGREAEVTSLRNILLAVTPTSAGAKAVRGAGASDRTRPSGITNGQLR